MLEGAPTAPLSPRAVSVGARGRMQERFLPLVGAENAGNSLPFSLGAAEWTGAVPHWAELLSE